VRASAEEELEQCAEETRIIEDTYNFYVVIVDVALKVVSLVRVVSLRENRRERPAWGTVFGREVQPSGGGRWARQDQAS